MEVDTITDPEPRHSATNSTVELIRQVKENSRSARQRALFHFQSGRVTYMDLSLFTAIMREILTAKESVGVRDSAAVGCDLNAFLPEPHPDRFADPRSPGVAIIELLFDFVVQFFFHRDSDVYACHVKTMFPWQLNSSGQLALWCCELPAHYFVGKTVKWCLPEWGGVA